MLVYAVCSIRHDSVSAGTEKAICHCEEYDQTAPEKDSGTREQSHRLPDATHRKNEQSQLEVVIVSGGRLRRRPSLYYSGDSGIVQSAVLPKQSITIYNLQAPTGHQAPWYNLVPFTGSLLQFCGDTWHVRRRR